MTTADTRPVYHVRHDLQPALTEELLVLLWDKSPCRPAQVQQTAVERGYRLAERSFDQLIASLGNLGLVEHRAGGLTLSSLGQVVARVAKYQPHLLPDVVHFTYYTLYDAAARSPRFSWAYRVVCDHLWAGRQGTIDSHGLIALVHERAQQEFADYDTYGVSFSANSVTGIVNWLEALDPPCATREGTTRTFARRAHCSVELLRLALDYAHRAHGTPGSALLPLTGESRRMIAQLCLLDEECLDEAIADTAEACGLIVRRTDRTMWVHLDGGMADIPFAAWYP